MSPPPQTTAFGALVAHITGGHLSADGDSGGRSFQPMNVNFGLFPPLAAAPQGKRAPKGLDRKRALAARALADLDLWLARPASVAAE
jgi:methylenetetrahydrofolate--tRNA-(uracil-5-)-methyltransferase